MTIDLADLFLAMEQKNMKHLVNLFCFEVSELVAKSSLEGLIIAFVGVLLKRRLVQYRQELCGL